MSRTSILYVAHTVSLGYASWIGKYSEDDAVITKILYACGAVPFVMTNVPQTLLVCTLVFQTERRT